MQNFLPSYFTIKSLCRVSPPQGAKNLLRIVLYSLVIVICIAAILLLHSFRAYLFPELLDLIANIVAVGAIVGTALALVPSLVERIEDVPELKAFRNKQAFVIFGVLMAVGSTLVVIETFVFARSFGDGPTDIHTLYSICYGVMVPIFTIILLFALWLKVKDGYEIGKQKIYLQEMAQARLIGDLCLPAVMLKPLPRATHAAFSEMLTRLCISSLKAASPSNGLSIFRRRGRVAILFVADVEKEEFIPVALAGGSLGLWKAINKNKPKFIDIEQFIATYNKYHQLFYVNGDGKRISKKKRQEAVKNFRKEVSAFSSTEGLVYELERRFSGSDVYRRCLTSNFSFLQGLEGNQQEWFRFRQIVAIPIMPFERRVGVLILAARRNHTFRSADRIHWVIGDMLGSALEYGLSRGLLARHGDFTSTENFPRRNESAHIDKLLSRVNTLRHDFSQSCSPW